jgi:membrane-associated HD superfamily phosphohydrolase
MKRSVQSVLLLTCCVLLMAALSSCSSTYYGAMEKVGVHKRDILVDRVEAGRDSQEDAQKQFQSALEQFDSIVKLEETDLKKAYDKFDKEYKKCRDAADDVSTRIDKIESVADALFKEWKSELKEYENKNMRRSSEKQLVATKSRYADMLATMKTAEESMEPVLQIFHDNVLFLKHNLNAQAIGSLQSEFASLESHIDELVQSMNVAIASSNKFIAEIKE